MNSMILVKRLLWSLMLVAIAGCQSNVSENTLVIGVSADYPPFEFQQEGTLSGFDIELGHAIGQVLNKQVIWQEMSFASLIPALQSKKIHMVISSMSINDQRKKVVDFTSQYFDNHIAYVIPKTSHATLTKKRVGVQLGSTMEQVANNLVTQYEFQVFSLPSNPQIIEELKIGRLDGMLVEKAQAIEFTRLHPDLTYISFSSLVNEPLEPTGYAIAVNKGDTLLKDINQALNQLEKDGTIKQLKKKWFHSNDAI